MPRFSPVSAPRVDTTPTRRGARGSYTKTRQQDNSPNVVPLTTAMRQTRELAEAADWDGDEDRAKGLWRQYENLKARHLDGELYEVSF